MKLLKTLAVLVLIAGAFAGGYLVRATKHAGAPSAGRRVLYYVDPMHPAYTSDKPGVAPDCGMTLEPVYADDPTAPAAGQKALYYRDPQQPEYKADKPGLNPETGNTLEPVYAAAARPNMPPGTERKRSS